MKILIKIPQQGLTTDYVTIGEWFVKQGEKVNAGDVIASIESEKAMLEITSPITGIVNEILKPKGDEVKIGEVIAVIEGE